MQLPRYIVSPTIPHRLPRSLGIGLIELLRTKHDVNAWAFIMEDHLLEDLARGGFKNDPEAANFSAEDITTGASGPELTGSRQRRR
jgi:hypothetical protein